MQGGRGREGVEEERGERCRAPWEKRRRKRTKKRTREVEEECAEGGEKGVEGRPVESPRGRKKG